MYKKENELADKIAERFGIFYTWAYHKFYMDELYLFVTKTILFKGIATAAWLDKNIVDGTMNAIGNSTVKFSDRIKGLQSGRIQDYAMAFVSGIVLLAIVFIYIWTN